MTVLEGALCSQQFLPSHSSTGPQLPLRYQRQTTPAAIQLSLIELLGFHTVDFTCGFADEGSAGGTVSVCSQIAQFCTSAITRHQVVLAAARNFSLEEMPTVGYIEILPYTEYGCGLKYPNQFSIRCTIPCSLY